MALWTVIDLAVDSDNNDANDSADSPERTADEDDEEDYDETGALPEPVPGKIIQPNFGDDDGNGIPNYADGLNLFPGQPNGTGGTFVPMIATFPLFLTAKFDYDLSIPTAGMRNVAADGTVTYTPNDGMFRVWRKAGKAVRDPRYIEAGGDLVHPGISYTHTQLAPGSTSRPINLYVECIAKPGANTPSGVAARRISMHITGTLNSILDWNEADQPGDSVLLLPFEIEGHWRGTINTPGDKVPNKGGDYGQSTVMMENANSEDNTSGPDYSKATKDKDKDSDLVEVILRWPKNMKINGARLELKQTGMQVDGSKSIDQGVAETGTSHLNFYDKDGNKLNPSTDLVIQDMGNLDGSYLAQILSTGELKLFIEGAEKFGYEGSIANSGQCLGGAMLKFEFTQNGTTSRHRLLVYRGGFLCFKQPENAPGTIGTLYFYDGKGRVQHQYGGHGNEFKTDVTEWGKVIYQWSAKSGKHNGADYNVVNGRGHTPPGWWTPKEKGVPNADLDKSYGTGQNKRIDEGAMCRCSRTMKPILQSNTRPSIITKLPMMRQKVSQPQFTLNFFSHPFRQPVLKIAMGLQFIPMGNVMGHLAVLEYKHGRRAMTFRMPYAHTTV